MQKRIYGLDILRALAILEVVYAHSHRFANTRLPFLFDGVGVFFVLSGYLIGNILLKTINTEFNSLISFWKRRWLRTLPAYYFVLICIVLFHVVRNNHIPSLFSYLTFTGSITDAYNPYLFPESWSLCVEEWFYLVIPILFYLTLLFFGNKKMTVLSWSLFIITGAIITRTLYIPHIQLKYYNEFIYQPVIFRFDNIMYGVLGAWLSYYKHPIWKNKNTLFISGICIYSIICIHENIGPDFFTYYFIQTLQAIAALMLLPKLSSIKKGSGFIFRSITFVSLVSYSIYLLNLTPFQLFIGKFELFFRIHSNLLNFALYLIFTFGGAYLMYRLIEKPFMNLRDKKPYKRLNKIDEDKEYLPIETSH